MSLSQLEPSTSFLIVDSGIEMKADWNTAKDNLREFTASFKKPTTGSSGRSEPLRSTAAIRSANAPAGAVTNRHVGDKQNHVLMLDQAVAASRWAMRVKMDKNKQMS